MTARLGPADAVGTEAVLEQHAFRRQFVDIWCWVDALQPPAVRTNRVWGMVIRENEQDVRPFGGE